MSDSVHLLTGAYAVDALDDDERRGFEQHLLDCPDCTAEVRELLETSARLGGAEAVEPPPDLFARVMAEVERTRQDRPGAVVVPMRPRRSRAVVVLGVAAAFLAVVAVGLSVALAQSRSTQSQLSASAQQMSAVLSAPDARTVTGEIAGGGRGAVVVSSSQNGAVFVAAGLGAAPGGHVYELWFIDSAGKATPAGTFEPTSAGTAAIPMSGSPDSAAVVGMTVEPAGGSSQPTTKPVLAVKV
jgi:anti-sigma-K factor RskA